jgi:hypothetical protein
LAIVSGIAASVIPGETVAVRAGDAGLAELLSAPAWEFTTFPNTENQHELVLA